MPQNDQYIEKIKARLDQWNAEIDKLEARSKEAEADTKIEYQKQLDGLREQRDRAEAQLEEIRNATDEAWSELESGFDKAWQDISTAFDNAFSKFK